MYKLKNEFKNVVNNSNYIFIERKMNPRDQKY
jgi:hypothetical protein